jgi:hypothetical protein
VLIFDLNVTGTYSLCVLFESVATLPATKEDARVKPGHDQWRRKSVRAVEKPYPFTASHAVASSS